MPTFSSVSKPSFDYSGDLVTTQMFPHRKEPALLATPKSLIFSFFFIGFVLPEKEKSTLIGLIITNWFFSWLCLVNNYVKCVFAGKISKKLALFFFGKFFSSTFFHNGNHPQKIFHIFSRTKLPCSLILRKSSRRMFSENYFRTSWKSVKSCYRMKKFCGLRSNVPLGKLVLDISLVFCCLNFSWIQSFFSGKKLFPFQKHCLFWSSRSREQIL